MSTEKMIITEKNGGYVNNNLNFSGSLKEAKEFARLHNFAGGVEIYDRKTKKFIKA